MRYFIWIEEDPRNPEYGEPEALFRFGVTSDDVITEKWYPKTDEWKHCPSVIAVTEIGGASDYHEVNEAEVESIKEKIREILARYQQEWLV